MPPSIQDWETGTLRTPKSFLRVFIPELPGPEVGATSLAAHVVPILTSLPLYPPRACQIGGGSAGPVLWGRGKTGVRSLTIGAWRGLEPAPGTPALCERGGLRLLPGTELFEVTEDGVQRRSGVAAPPLVAGSIVGLVSW